MSQNEECKCFHCQMETSIRQALDKQKGLTVVGKQEQPKVNALGYNHEAKNLSDSVGLDSKELMQKIKGIVLGASGRKSVYISEIAEALQTGLTKKELAVYSASLFSRVVKVELNPLSRLINQLSSNGDS